MPEDNVKHSKWEEGDKKRSIAYSMKLVNGVYNKLIEVFAKQVQHIDNEEYTRGWNAAFTSAVEMIRSCKYTKDDYLNLIREEDDADETATDSI